MRMVETMALAERIATGSSNHTVREFHLALAVLNMEKALASCRANDRSALYAPGEDRRDGKRPSGDTRWMTPREIVEQLYAVPGTTVARPSEASQAALAVERAIAATPSQPGEPS